MPGLELQFDADRFNRQLDQSAAKVKQVGTQAEVAQTQVNKAAESMTQSGQRISAAWGVGASSLAIAGSIQATSSALRGMNTELAVLSSSRALLDLGRLGGKIATIGLMSGRATGVMGSLLGIVARASPWVALAGAAASVAAAFIDVGNNSEKAAAGIEKQANAISGLLARTRELDIRRDYGAGDPRASVGGTIDALTALQTSDRRRYSGADAAGIYGLSEDEVRRAIARGGVGEGALEVSTFDPVTGRPRLFPRYTRQDFTREDLIGAGEFLLQQRRDAAALSARTPSAGRGGYEHRAYAPFDSVGLGGEFSLRDDPAFGFDPIGRFRGGVRISPTDQLRVTGENIERASEVARQNFERMRDLGADIGRSIGQAAGDLIFAGRSLRDSLAGVLEGFGRSLLNQGFSALGAAVFGGGASPAGRESFTPQR